MFANSFGCKQGKQISQQLSISLDFLSAKLSLLSIGTLMGVHVYSSFPFRLLAHET